jgi:hypothetical protein
MGNSTPQEARHTAEAAYIFAFSTLEKYKTMYVQVLVKACWISAHVQQHNKSR